MNLLFSSSFAPVFAVLFQKLPTREERLSTTGDNEVVWFPLSEKASDALCRYFIAELNQEKETHLIQILIVLVG